MRTQAPKYPSSFFDDYPQYRSNVETAALEATQHAFQVCSGYFYYCKSNPIISQVMASHPLTESALVSGLKGCLDTFSAKVAELAADCRAGAGLVVENLMRDLDRVDPRRPQLADRLPRIVEPFVDKHWHERESALKADIKLLFERVIWKPLQDTDESSPEPINLVQQVEREWLLAFNQRSRDDTPYPEPVELRLALLANPVADPIRPPLSASLLSCMAIDGMPSEYDIRSMTHIDGSRYLMNVHDCDASTSTICNADINTASVTSIVKHDWATNIVARDNIIVMFKCNYNAAVLDSRRMKIPVREIGIKCRYRYVSGWCIADKWCQQLNDDIYIIDNRDRLQRISWQDIKAGRYTRHSVVDSNVEDFYMHDQGNAILKTTGTLVLNAGRHSVEMHDMHDTFSSVKWSTVIKSADRWIVCGDRKDSSSTIVSLDDRGVVISSVSIVTRAAWGDAFIKYLKTAIVRRHEAIILAIDVNSCCHLISMTASGHLHTLDSTPTLCRCDIKYPDEWYKQITSMTETDTEGQYIVAGYMWIKKLTVRLN